MITPELVKTSKSKKLTAHCTICAGSSLKIVRLISKYAVVCKKCLKMFSTEELELMDNMFAAFGGYFRKCASSQEETYQELEKIAEEYSSSSA